MSSGSGPTIPGTPGGPGAPEEPQLEDDAGSSPEDAPVRSATTLPPTQVIVVPTVSAVGPTSRLRRAPNLDPGERPLAVAVAPLASAPLNESDPSDSVDSEPVTTGARVPVAAGISGTPLRVTPSPAMTGRPAEAKAEPRVRSSPSVMASPTTLSASRDFRVAEGHPGARASDFIKPAYGQRPQPLGPVGRRGGAPSRAADAPIAKDLFREGMFEELDSAIPPFDDHPAQVMEDVGQPYMTGYTVADPPPIPGIADRFTPPAALPTELGSRRGRSDSSASPNSEGRGRAEGRAKADGMARAEGKAEGKTERKERFEPTPAPSRRTAMPRLAAASPSQTVPSSEHKPTRNWLWFGVFGMGFGVVGLVALGGAIALVYGGSNRADEDMADVRGAPSEDRRPQGALAPPGLTGEPPEPLPTDDRGRASAPAAPVTTGTLKVRANRRALVYVDDQVITYTPLSYDLPPGPHAVSAMMPGQPNSRQTREISIPKAGETVAIEFTF